MFLPPQIYNLQENELENEAYQREVQSAPARYYRAGSITNISSRRGTTGDRADSSDENILTRLRRLPANYQPDPTRTCLGGTRVSLLERIYQWTSAPDTSGLAVLWLKGAAGSGKSAVALTVSEECRRRKCLGANFFFSRADPDRRNGNLFFSTIAYQLAAYCPEFGRHITNQVSQYPDVSNSTLSQQFHNFILHPLTRIPEGSVRTPVVIIVDAIECLDSHVASEILHLFVDNMTSLTFPLKLFITSRSEPHIESVFRTVVQANLITFDLVQDIDPLSTERDIRLYLDAYLGAAVQETVQMQNLLPTLMSSWPAEEDLAMLVQECQGLFINAATAVEFIADVRIRDPQGQLQKFLHKNSTPRNSFSSTPVPGCPPYPNRYKEHLCSVLNIPITPVIDLSEYIDRGTFIASGGFGQVYRAKWKCVDHIQGDGLQVFPNVALKIINIPSLDDERQKDKRLKKMKRELELWSKLNHDNVLPLVGFARIDNDSNLPAFISPWMQDGCVMDFLKKTPSFPVPRILCDIVKGLHYLHTFNPEIVHGDMKAANVLINGRGEACLCDFGLSRFAVDNTLWRTTATQANGTLRWMAPELLAGEESVPTKASDMYAFAMTSYEILSRAPPFETTRNDFAVMTKVMRGGRPIRNDSCRPEALWSIITQCWAQDPNDRPQTGRVLILMQGMARLG